MQLAEPVHLPPLRQCKIYLNLTNGIEALPRLQQHGLPFSFVRIQSTACEQQLFERLVDDLDADLLLHLALGYCCVVVDFGSRNRKRGASRALWWGTEFIRYALTRTWLDRPAQAFLRGHSVAALFERQVQGFSKSTKKRLRYFKRVIPPGGLDEVRLVGAYAATAQDGCGTFYQQALWAGLLPGRQGQPGGEQGQAATAAARAEGEAAGLSQGDGAELVELSHEERERLLDGDCAVAVQRLLGLSLFLGGVSHAVLQRLDSSMDEDEQQQAGG